MMKMKKIISMLLTVFMLLGSMSAILTFDVLAADGESAEGASEATTEPGGAKEEETVEAVEEIDYITEIFATPDDKIKTMRLALEKDGYQLYVDDYSGEVACVNTKTGEKLFTNPYDVGASTGNETTKYEILSQIIVKFTDQQGQNKTFTSYEQAALREQIVTEPIKNGLRVEYTIGREQTKTLVPRLISRERFDEMIMGPLLEAFGDDLYSEDPTNEVFQIQKFLTYYIMYSKEVLDVSKAEKDRMNNIFGGIYDGLINSDRQLTKVLKDYPIVDNMAVYVFDPEASESEVAKCEELILTYCPDYTYEELDYDHALTEYESEDENPPVFRMALEYKLDADGLSVRLPANGIRFNESLYTLENIEILPYMGAGNSGYAGYNFFPDGSGTLFDYEELNTAQTRSVMGKVYGTDFAYHEITGTYQKTIRYPVFGVVEESTFYTYTTTDIDSGEVTKEVTVAGAMVEAIRAYNAGEAVRVYKGKESALSAKLSSEINAIEATETKSENKRGFLAIIEEGDALASLATYHAGPLSDYNTIKMSFTPRPKDSYNIRDSISVGSNSEWTVVSDRKYVGGYKIKYIMLSDSKNEAEAAKAYDASWFGMATAYRDYLTAQGVISKLTSEELTKDIPLYIETFGAVETTEKILSIPVTVMAPLTTFEDILQIYTDLSEQGITNVNFKLTGFANGGMYYHAPGKLKFEKEVGGNEGFQTLLDEAKKINDADKDNNLGIFPDFDFAYNIWDKSFDGYSSREHAARTIDDRYASKKVYSATTQKYMNYYELAVSPAYYYVFYEMLEENYLNEYQNVYGISVSTLGHALNSDFDEDEPYNREDSKDFTIKAFEYFDSKYDSVMTEGGNAYVWKYVDHMLDVALDSSRYNFSSNAVPFIGVVLHGSVSFAGEPLNMEGDLQYAILKAIENGASPYFILSVRNTQALKTYFDLSQYYSIRYDIWSKDIADVYETLNGALADVQDKYITGHEFLSGERIPDTDELEADILTEYLADLDDERNAAEIIAKEIALSASVARQYGREAEEFAADAVLEALTLYTSQQNQINSALRFDTKYFDELCKAYEALEPVRKYRNSDNDAEKALFTSANNILTVVSDFNIPYADAKKAYDALNEKMQAVAAYEEYKNDFNRIVNAFKSYLNVNADKKEEKYADLQEIVDLCRDNAVKYLEFLATDMAFDMVLSSGFDLDFDECYDICHAAESTDCYSSYQKYVKNGTATEDEVTRFTEYAAAQNALKDLETKVGSYKSGKGSVDNYIMARAQLVVREKLGYATSDDASLVKLYNDAKTMATNTRTTAINATARIVGINLNSLRDILEAVEEYLDLATAAITTLANAEGVTVEYKEGSDKSVTDITNYDEIAKQSPIVKQAIDRALAVYEYLNSESYEEIKDGRETDYVLHGNKLVYNRDTNGDRVYQYGTNETGYSYFTLEVDKETGDESFKLYHMGTKTGAKTEEGLDIYEFKKDSVTYYYTATDDNGYTYYTRDEFYGSYYMKAPTVYSGKLVDTLADGTEIYLDGTVYYSENEDGTYTRYTYCMSIKDYCQNSIDEAEAARATAETMAVDSGDTNFATDVQKRIDRNNVSVDKDDEDETVEETVSRYATENMVAVTYGNADGSAYKTIILNYNNYTVRVVYDGIEYSIPAYEFVIIER